MKYIFLMLLTISPLNSYAVKLKCGNGGPGSGTGCSACDKPSCALTRGCGWGTGGCSQNGGAFTINDNVTVNRLAAPKITKSNQNLGLSAGRSASNPNIKLEIIGGVAKENCGTGQVLVTNGCNYTKYDYTKNPTEVTTGKMDCCRDIGEVKSKGLPEA